MSTIIVINNDVNPIVDFPLILSYNSTIMKDSVQPPVEGLLSQSPVVLRLGETPLNPGLHRGNAGTAFEVRFSEAANASTRAYVLRTPLGEYVPAHDAISQRDGELVDLGDIPSMISGGEQGFETSLDANAMYDVFVVHNDQLTPTRITTGENAPTGMTFDEVKLLLAVKVGLSPEELTGISGTVIADKVNMRNRNELAHFGLQVDNLVATISQQPFGMFFVDRDDFWKVPTREEFRESLLGKKSDSSE